MSNLGTKLKHELRELIPVTLFFFVSFQLLALTEALMLKQYGIHAATFLGATLMALIVAKVVMLTDHFALVNRFPEKPLIYNVAWKTVIYFVASLLVRYTEHLIHFWRQSAGFGEANRRIVTEVIWPHFLAVQLWLLVLLLIYCAFRELVRALGRKRIVAMFFTEPVRGNDSAGENPNRTGAAIGTVFAISLLAAAPTLGAAEAESDQATELAKQLSNPVASLISVPFQGNYDFDLGPTGDGSKFTLNIQPVVPVSISKDWNVIVRTILPVIDQHDVFYPALPQDRNQSGLGDIVQSFFFSPKAPGPSGIISGFGPVILYPSATDDLLGGEKWGLGPTLVLLKQDKGWTYGVLANQIWSIAGDNDRNNISATFLQPFVSYTTKMHTTFSVNTESTYNWEDSQWTVPINLSVSQILKLGKQPVSIQLGVRYYAEAPRNGSDWGLRLAFTLLYPQGKHHSEPETEMIHAK